MKHHRWMAALAAAMSLSAPAACLTDEQVSSLVQDYLARRPAADLPPQDEAGAACSRRKLQAALAQRLGPPIGYKVGLTNPAIRRMLKADGPAWGALFPGALLPGGSQVSAAFGAAPTVEADLLVRVASSAIHRATTPAEVLQSLDQVIPFIELPDMMVTQPLRLDGHAMAALNMSARLGVAGEPIAVPADAAARGELLEALGRMKLSMKDGNGRVVGQGQGSDLMGHPLNAALWLVQALAREGITLQPGQYLSLGSFPPVLPTRPGLRFEVTYDGLPGAKPVWVQFTP